MPVPQTGLIGSEQALQGGLLGGLNALQTGVNQGRADLAGIGGEGIQRLNTYFNPGVAANRQQALLSGALGPEQQQQAYSNFMSSPGQQYLRDQGEQAILRNSAALGGLGGANVMRELQQHGIGMAAQDFDNSFNRLSGLANRGLQAGNAQMQGGLQTAQGMADLARFGGGTAGQMFMNTGQNIAGGRTRAGEMISSNIGNTSSALASILAGTGQTLGDQLMAGNGNIANLLTGQGAASAQGSQNLAALLANIATGQGSQLAALPGIPGVQHEEGALSGIGQAAGGIGGLMTGWNA